MPRKDMNIVESRRGPMTNMKAPTLITPRLKLRAHLLSDFENVAALWADPEVIRKISGVPSTREQSWARLLRNVGHWSLLGFGFWVVETAEDSRFVGEVGLGSFKRDLKPSVPGIPEAGWVLSASEGGKGFATEAMDAVLQWIDTARQFPTTFALFDPSHTASLRVAEKLGFAESSLVSFAGEPALIRYRQRGARRMSV